MENAGSSTVSGSKEAMEDGSPEELHGFAKTWRAKYSVVQRSKRAPFPAYFSTDIQILPTIRHVYRSAWPAREAKPRFDSETR